ncbi:MAG: tetratricopeptide repeat protein, partial [Cyanobacteria bacterium P01_A01_bin.83]
MLHKNNRHILYLICLLVASVSLSGCQQSSNAQKPLDLMTLEKSNFEPNSPRYNSANFSPEQLNQAKELADLGYKKSQDGDLLAALELTEQALKVFPGYARAYFNRGKFRNTLDDNIHGALADYTKAIKLYPDDLSPPLTLRNAYKTRSLLRSDLEDNLGAVADATEAIKLAPDDAQAYTNRGWAYFAQSEYELAIADYTRAIELTPNVPGWYFNRGRANYSAGYDQQALADFNQAIALNANFGWAYHQRGFVNKELGNFLAAESDYTKSIAMGYKTDNSYYWRGKVRLELKEYQKAIADFDLVIGTGSKSPDDYHSRFIAHHYLGDYTAAQADARKAAELYL